MLEGQKNIYYVSGKTKEQALNLPQMALLKKKGYDCLVLSEDVDEFMLQTLKDYDGVEFKSINQGNLDLLDEAEKENIKKIAEDNKDLLDTLKEDLKDDVVDVIISERLVDSPCCLTTKDGLSLEMEKVLELNPNHDMFKHLVDLNNNNKDELKELASYLYDSALIVEGLSPKDPVKFADYVCKLMLK